MCALATWTVYIHCNTHVRVQNRWLCQCSVSKCGIIGERYGRRERDTHHSIRTFWELFTSTSHCWDHFNSDWSPSPKAVGASLPSGQKTSLTLLLFEFSFFLTVLPPSLREFKGIIYLYAYPIECIISIELAYANMKGFKQQKTHSLRAIM